MKRILCLCLCLTLLTGLLAGCREEPSAYVPTGDGLTWDEDYTGPVNTEPVEEEVQKLSLAYYPEAGLNPLVCNEYINRIVFSLVYQSLFVTDRDYRISPMLCSRFSVSEDMMTYTFYIDPDATFTDGSPVTADDVYATIHYARYNGVYRYRFNSIVGMSVTDDGGLVIQLNTPHDNYPALLDIPILPQEEVEDPTPMGSGPYVLYSSIIGARLEKKDDWWCKESTLAITAEDIALVETASVNDVRDEFQFGDVDLVLADPGSDRYADYLCDYELWDCENGIFLFLACHSDSAYLQNDKLRKALTYAIDREIIATEFYRGFAAPATLPASPQYPYYNQVLAQNYDYDPALWKEAVQEAGLTGATLTLAVNGQDTLRLRAAEAIATMMEAGGINVEVLNYSGASFIYVLNNMEFDMFLGQTMLSPNMDLSHFFSESGNLNYCGLSNANAYDLCQQALENQGNYYTLHYTVMEEGLLCPILFRSYAVYATRGLLTDLSPARDNIFYYTIGKTLDEAYIK